MVGYLNNDIRVLNEWFQLFQKKHPNISEQEYKHWEKLQQLKLPYPKKNCKQYIPFKNFLEHHFITFNTIQDNIIQYNKLKLPIDSYQLVFINGLFSHILSDKLIDPWILKINYDNNRYKKITRPINPEIFLYLTECLSNATISLTLPKNKITKKPLYLLYINEGSDIKQHLNTLQYHHLFKIENNTNASIIEHFISINNFGHFSGTRVSMSIGHQAKLNHTKLIFENRTSYHISHHDIRIGCNSHVESNIFSIFGPKFTYQQISAQLNYKKSSLSLNSLTILANNDSNNFKTYLEHNNIGYALSKQIHKVIAQDCSINTFNGLIKVNRGSIDTDGKMINNNLLLNESATITTIPKLEIYSDRVKCSHGATIGKIDLNQLFFLRSRGISYKEAINTLIHAFTMEIIEKIKITPIKNIILDKINHSLTKAIFNDLCYRKN